MRYGQEGRSRSMGYLVNGFACKNTSHELEPFWRGQALRSVVHNMANIDVKGDLLTERG